MAGITIRLDDALYDRLVEKARAVRTTPSAYIRDVLDRTEGMDPSGYHARFDELHATVIQIFAVLATSVGERFPQILQKGLSEAKRLLREGDLLDPAQDIP